MTSVPESENLPVRALLPSAREVDLNNCDREPIHIPGGIQPHGVLLTLDESDFSIVQVSANTIELLGQPVEAVLGTHLQDWLSDEAIAQLQRFIERKQLDNNPLHITTATFGDNEFDVIGNYYNGTLIVELEVLNKDFVWQPELFFSLIKAVEGRLNQTETVLEFCQATAEEVRALTNFDRVMIYKFDEDGHGWVLAEDKRDDIEPFLGLHYPESDIPKQARAMALITSVRYLPDVYYDAVPLLPVINPLTQKPLDMTCSSLRSMSRMYTEYLMNMKVSATLTVSLIKDGKLWGLIACHHYSGPFYVPYSIRMGCEFLGRAASLLLSAKEEGEHQEYREHLRAVATEFVGRMIEFPADYALLEEQPNGSNFIRSSGVAVLHEGKLSTRGQTPGEETIKKLGSWLQERENSNSDSHDHVWHTNALSRDWPDGADVIATASGVAAVALSGDWSNFVMWFRPEVLQTLNWAGDPRKPVEFEGESNRMRPRGSFALWQETVRHSAEPWTKVEIEALTYFRRAIARLVLTRVAEVERLNSELLQSNEDLRAFAYVASHDLKEPLRGIHNFSHFLLEDYEDKLEDDGRQKLDTIIRLTQRMETLLESLLYYSRAGRKDLNFVEVDNNHEVREALQILERTIEEQNIAVSVPESLPTVKADRSIVGEIWLNLLTNAIKYNDKDEKWIEIGYELSEGKDKQPIFYVRDNGIGIATHHVANVFQIFRRLHARNEFGGGVGAGLTIVKKIVERHGGQIWLQSEPGVGSTFYFSLSPNARPSAHELLFSPTANTPD